MKRSAVPAAALIVALALVGLLVYGLVSRGENTTLDDAVAKGGRPAAPDRTLPVLGRPTATRSLADLRGKVVVLNFWASWCDPCREEAPVLERAQKRLTRSGTGTVLGVTFRDLTPDSQRFVRRFGLSYPSIRDVDGKLANAYGTRALPETFVIDPRGRVAGLSRGTVSAAFLDRAIARAQRAPGDQATAQRTP